MRVEPAEGSSRTPENPKSTLVSEIKEMADALARLPMKPLPVEEKASE